MTPSQDARSLARLAARLQNERDEQETARAIVASALEMVGEAQHAALAVRRRRGRHETLAASSDLAALLDSEARELDEGPHVSAISTPGAIRSGDVARDGRWPVWGPRASSRGVGSVLSIRLVDGGSTIGTLTLYSTRMGRFHASDTADLAQIFATHASWALATAHELEGLETAVSSRHTIGMAQGILMARYSMSPERAFAVLRRVSSTSNMKLLDVARHVVGNGALTDVVTPQDRLDGEMPASGGRDQPARRRDRA